MGATLVSNYRLKAIDSTGKERTINLYTNYKDFAGYDPQASYLAVKLPNGTIGYAYSSIALLKNSAGATTCNYVATITGKPMNRGNTITYVYTTQPNEVEEFVATYTTDSCIMPYSISDRYAGYARANVYLVSSKAGSAANGVRGSYGSGYYTSTTSRSGGSGGNGGAGGTGAKYPTFCGANYVCAAYGPGGGGGGGGGGYQTCLGYGGGSGGTGGAAGANNSESRYYVYKTCAPETYYCIIMCAAASGKTGCAGKNGDSSTGSCGGAGGANGAGVAGSKGCSSYATCNSTNTLVRCSNGGAGGAGAATSYYNPGYTNYSSTSNTYANRAASTGGVVVTKVKLCYTC